MLTYIAHTIKGLEFITKLELSDKITGIESIHIGPKKVSFNVPKFPPMLQFENNLRTFDDLSLLLDQIEFDQPLEIVNFFEDIDLKNYKELLSQMRDVQDSFSLTISLYKNRNVDKDKLKSNIAAKISAKYKWKYTPLSHENFDIRIMIERNLATLLIKIYRKSLFYRSYRVGSQKGAIRPSIAGAMTYFLTRGEGNRKVVDNFCGGGTFLCEALLDGNQVYGGDISAESVVLASKNLNQISNNFKLKVLDARNSVWKNDYFDIAISNLPWGKHVPVNSFMNLYSESIKEYGRILKPNGSIALIGSKPDLMKKYVKGIFPRRSDKSVKKFFVGYLGQRPGIVISRMVD